MLAAPIYTAMITRTPESEGPDPLVPQPLNLGRRK